MSRAASQTRDISQNRPIPGAHLSYRDSSLASAPEATDIDMSEVDEADYASTAGATSRPVMSPRTNTDDSQASTPTHFGLEPSAEHHRPLVGSSSTGRRVSYALSTTDSVTDAGTATPTADVFNGPSETPKVAETIAEEANSDTAEQETENGTVLEQTDSGSDDDSVDDDDVECQSSSSVPRKAEQRVQIL